MGIVETILSNVCQADVIACIEIEHIEAYTATKLDTTVKTVEIAVVKGTERCACAVVLDLTIGSHCQVAAHIGLDSHLVADEVLVLDEQGHFQIIEIVGEVASSRIALATLLAIIESSLEKQRSAVAELSSCSDTDIQA